jgi:hypothetical protein
MAQAATDMRDTGSRIYIPANCKIKMGGAAQVWMRGMAFESDGVRDYGPVMGRHGGLILLTDQTKSPFLVSDSWGMRGLEFYWPNQVLLAVGGSPLAYPALIGTHNSDTVVLADFDNNQIVNAYDLIDFTAATVSGHFHVESNSVMSYITLSLFKQFRVRRGSVITSFLQSHGKHLLRRVRQIRHSRGQLRIVRRSTSSGTATLA